MSADAGVGHKLDCRPAQMSEHSQNLLLDNLEEPLATYPLHEVPFPVLQHYLGGCDSLLRGLRASSKDGRELANRLVTVAKVLLESWPEVTGRNVGLAKLLVRLCHLKRLSIRVQPRPFSPADKAASLAAIIALLRFLVMLNQPLPHVTDLSVNIWPLNVAVVQMLVVKFPSVQTFTTRKCGIFHVDQQQLFATMTLWNKLRLLSLYMADVCDALDCSSISVLTQVTQLDICGDKLTNLSAISSMTNLQSLALSEYHNREMDWSPILERLTGLQSLHLSNMAATAINALTALAVLTCLKFRQFYDSTAFPCLPSLQEVHSKHAPSLASVLHACHNVRVIDVGPECWLIGDSLAPGTPCLLADITPEEVLAHLQALAAIDAWACGGKSEKGLTRSISTDHLSFHDKALDTDFWQSAAIEQLTPLRTWRRVNIGNITQLDQGEVDFVVSKFPCVTHLSISHCEIATGASLIPLTRLPLVEVVFHYCYNISEKDVEALQHAFNMIRPGEVQVRLESFQPDLL